jgi:hypothetical protein
MYRFGTTGWFAVGCRKGIFGAGCLTGNDGDLEGGAGALLLGSGGDLGGGAGALFLCNGGDLAGTGSDGLCGGCGEAIFRTEDGVGNAPGIGACFGI